MITVELTGLPELTQAFQRLAQQAQQALVLALDAEANRILEASQPLVPLDTGDLVRSGTVITGTDGSEVRYGNFGAVPYALVQHEETSFNHPRGGEHHYLSKPFLEATGDMATRLAADIASHLKP
jgi:hypothetical protein